MALNQLTLYVPSGKKRELENKRNQEAVDSLKAFQAIEFEALGVPPPRKQSPPLRTLEKKSKSSTASKASVIKPSATPQVSANSSKRKKWSTSSQVAKVTPTSKKVVSRKKPKPSSSSSDDDTVLEEDDWRVSLQVRTPEIQTMGKSKVQIRLEAEIADLQYKLNNQGEEINKVAITKDELQQTVDNLTNGADAGKEMGRLTSKLGEYKANLNRATKANTDLAAQGMTLKAKLEQMAANQKKLQAKLDTSASAEKKLQGQVKELQIKAKATTKRPTNQKEANAKAKKEINELKVENSKLKKAAEEASRKASNAQKLLDNTTNTLNAKISKLQDELAKLEQTALNNNTSNKDKEIERLKAKIKELEQAAPTRHLEEDELNLAMKCDHERKENRKLQKNVEELAQQLRKSTTELKRLGGTSDQEQSKNVKKAINCYIKRHPYRTKKMLHGVKKSSMAITILTWKALKDRATLGLRNLGEDEETAMEEFCRIYDPICKKQMCDRFQYTQTMCFEAVKGKFIVGSVHVCSNLVQLTPNCCVLLLFSVLPTISMCSHF